jgi:nucleotide-binding universal stress UspA family protein
MIFKESGKPLKILLGMDGSEHSLAAVNFLSDLPLPATTTVTLLGVFLPREASNYTALIQPVQDSQSKLEKKGYIVQPDIVAGYPAEMLINYADQLEPDLIIVGAKGLRATLGILLGGVAQQVLEYASRPTLIVRAPYRKMERVILVTDGSPCSEIASDYLTCFSLPENVNLTAMHILPPLRLAESTLVAQSWPMGLEHGALIQPELEAALPEIEAEEQTRGEELLHHTVVKIKKNIQRSSPGVSVKSYLTRGDAATEIIRYARDSKVDLIIAGSRGLSQVRGWLLGSVSRKLVHYAPCSVLVVRCKQTQNP